MAEEEEEWEREADDIGHSCPLRTSDSDCYVDIMLIVQFQEYTLCQFPAPLVRIVYKSSRN